MKQPITVRLDPGLLAEAKREAELENRTLTNLIETLLKQRVAADGAPPASTDDGAVVRDRPDARRPNGKRA